MEKAAEARHQPKFPYSANSVAHGHRMPAEVFARGRLMEIIGSRSTDLSLPQPNLPVNLGGVTFKMKIHFFDSFHLYRIRGASFKMHRPIKASENPILTPRNDWEGWRTFPYGRAVLHDPADDLYKMWYETMQGRTTEWDALGAEWR